MFWIYLVVTLLFDLLSMTFARKYVLTDEKHFFVLALFGFLMVGLFMVQMLRFEGIAVANAIWGGFVVLATLLIGIFYFREQISLLQIIGVLTVVLGIVLIEWKSI